MLFFFFLFRMCLGCFRIFDIVVVDERTSKEFAKATGKAPWNERDCDYRDTSSPTMILTVSVSKHSF